MPCIMAKRRRGPAQRTWERVPPERRLGDAGVQEEIHKQMTAIMGAIDDFLNRGQKGNDRAWGVVIMMFPSGDVDGRCNYMSNGADRRDIVTLMREMIARFEGQPETRGSA